MSDSLQSPARLAALRQTGLLDSGADEAFDRLTRLATRALGVPVALVSLVDGDRQFFKSQTGLPEPWATARQTPLSHSFCQHVVTTARPLVVADARRHPLVRDNLAVPDLGVVAYAGIPLVTPEGHVLGSFCAIDTKPRPWSPHDLAILTDLAAAATAAIGLKSAKDAAEAANRAKDRFLAVLSHELRTPVSPALMLAASLAGDETLPHAAREDAGTILRNITQQTRLIDDLLDVTRIENGKLSMRAEAVDLHALLNDVVAMCQADADAKRVLVRLDPQARRHVVRGDPHRLRQVFCNLLKNAVKFTPAAGRVALRTSDAGDEAGACDAGSEGGGRVAVAVADTGIGVEPQVLARMFDAYEQGGRAITDEFSGLGLGLAISKGLVEAHGGSIAAASAGRGRGTTVTVELPATADPVAPERSAAAVPLPPGGDKPLSILLVDDHHDTLRAMSRLLRRRDRRVTIAASKTAALAAAANESFDLLISDLGLPDGTGLELMGELLAVGPIRGIALTGYGTDEDVQRSKGAGFDLHLTKPVNLDVLEAAIRELTA